MRRGLPPYSLPMWSRLFRRLARPGLGWLLLSLVSALAAALLLLARS